MTGGASEDCRPAVLALLADMAGDEAVEAAAGLEVIDVCEVVWLWASDHMGPQGSIEHRLLCRVEELGFEIGPNTRSEDLDDAERRALYRALGGRDIDFELDIVDPGTGSVEWRGDASDVIGADVFVEDRETVKQALDQLLDQPAGETLLLGRYWLRRLRR